MTEIFPIYLLRFIFISSDEKSVDLDIDVTRITTHPLPNIGDEIQFPPGLKTQEKTGKRIFTVKGRRFFMGQCPKGISGTIFIQVK